MNINDMKMKENISWNIRKHRLKKRISRRELSERSKVSENVLKFVENDLSYDIKIENLVKLAEALEINLEDLVSENG